MLLCTASHLSENADFLHFLSHIEVCANFMRWYTDEQISSTTLRTVNKINKMVVIGSCPIHYNLTTILMLFFTVTLPYIILPC